MRLKMSEKWWCCGPAFNLWTHILCDNALTVFNITKQGYIINQLLIQGTACSKAWLTNLSVMLKEIEVFSSMKCITKMSSVLDGHNCWQTHAYAQQTVNTDDFRETTTSALNTLRHKQIVTILTTTFLHVISSLKFVPDGPIDNKSAMVQVMIWY